MHCFIFSYTSNLECRQETPLCSCWRDKWVWHTHVTQVSAWETWNVASCNVDILTLWHSTLLVAELVDVCLCWHWWLNQCCLSAPLFLWCNNRCATVASSSYAQCLERQHSVIMQLYQFMNSETWEHPLLAVCSLLYSSGMRPRRVDWSHFHFVCSSLLSTWPSAPTTPGDTCISVEVWPQFSGNNWNFHLSRFQLPVPRRVVQGESGISALFRVSLHVVRGHSSN